MTFSNDEKRLIRSAYEAKSQKRIPAELKASIEASISQSPSDLARDETKQHSNRHWLGVAACALLSVAVGLVVLNSKSLNESSESSVAKANIDTGNDVDSHAVWVQRVVDYQSLYTENTVTAKTSMSENEALALIESMEIENSKIHTLPSFEDAGYRFARAQQLGFNGQPLVQLIYTKPGAMPLAFCFMPVIENTPRDLELSRTHELGVASWVDDQYHFVLVADEAEGVLQRLHRAALSIVKKS